MLVLLAALALFAAGCRTAPPPAFLRGTPLAVDDARATRLLDAYLADSAARSVLQGSARVALTGPDFKLNRPQNVVVARPARLRFEVVGLFEQLAAVLVTDGHRYGFYDASKGAMEEGAVTPGLLWSLAKVDVGIPEAVEILLAAPRPQAFAARAAVWQEESDRIGIGFTAGHTPRRHDCPADPEQAWRDAACFADAGALAEGGEAFVFDRDGRLVELRSFLADGVLRYRARFEQYGALGAGASRTDFPLVVTIESPAVGSEARFAWKRVMLGGEVADRLFRLPERGARW
ncbi:hypothetical protein K2X89_07980 [Myxococcota bacterium]|nr:hypothetical protein [Myxococcota bacterium]